jgi:hypothetical protein
MVAVMEILTAFTNMLIAPVKNPEMLWIIVPIYLNWILTDYYQERKGTSFGNAMSNGFTALWIGLDWTKQVVTRFAGLDAAFAIKLIVGVLFILFGFFIMIESAKAKPIIKYLGRIREVSYFAIVATPIYYNVIPINLVNVLAILVFFPVWYGIGEAFDRLLGPSLSEQEEETASTGIGLGGLGGEAMPEFSDLSAGAGVSQNQFGARNQQQQYPQQNYQQYPQQGQQWPPQF